MYDFFGPFASLTDPWCQTRVRPRYENVSSPLGLDERAKLLDRPFAGGAEAGEDR
jgi:hypothetical protein